MIPHCPVFYNPILYMYRSTLLPMNHFQHTATYDGLHVCVYVITSMSISQLSYATAIQPPLRHSSSLQKHERGPDL